MKRLVFTTVLFLLMGAIANIAVACGIARWTDRELPEWLGYSHDDSPRWKTSISTKFGMTVVSTVPLNGQWSETDATGRSPEAAATGAWRIPAWSRATGRPAQDVLDDASMPWRLEWGFGWPARSARAILQTNVGKPRSAWHAVSGLMLSSNPGRMRVLPLRPIWPGFAINTLLYGALLWLILATSFALRRRRRIKRGLCPKCAYPVGSSDVCTECGAAIATQKAVFE